MSRRKKYFDEDEDSLEDYDKFESTESPPTKKPRISTGAIAEVTSMEPLDMSSIFQKKNEEGEEENTSEFRRIIEEMTYDFIYIEKRVSLISRIIGFATFGLRIVKVSDYNGLSTHGALKKANKEIDELRGRILGYKKRFEKIMGHSCEEIDEKIVKLCNEILSYPHSVFTYREFVEAASEEYTTAATENVKQAWRLLYERDLIKVSNKVEINYDNMQEWIIIRETRFSLISDVNDFQLSPNQYLMTVVPNLKELVSDLKKLNPEEIPKMRQDYYLELINILSVSVIKTKSNCISRSEFPYKIIPMELCDDTIKQLSRYKLIHRMKGSPGEDNYQKIKTSFTEEGLKRYGITEEQYLSLT